MWLQVILQEFIQVFPDALGQTNAAIHDVDVGKAMPIKQHVYRINPIKCEYIHKEFEYMLQDGIVKPSQSQWIHHAYLCKNMMVVSSSARIS